jgi:hypothetical protein
MNYKTLKELQEWFKNLPPEEKRIQGKFFNEEKARLGAAKEKPPEKGVELGPYTYQAWMASRKIHYWHYKHSGVGQFQHEILIEEIVAEGEEHADKALKSYDHKFIDGKLIKRHLYQQ